MASLSDVAVAAPWAFVVGCALGFVVGARYRITLRNGKEGG
jgi:NhaP-type Na+/H+ or K+/H+ antiporter